MAATIGGAPIHIDKAARLYHEDVRNYSNAAELFAKVDLSRLDGPVKQVGFQGNFYLDSSTDGGAGSVTPVNYKAIPFAGSKDYFELAPFETSGGDVDSAQGAGHFTGQVYVETTNGTRYATDVGGGGDLVIDDRMVNGLHYSHDVGPVGYAPDMPDVSAIPETADFVDTPSSEQYLNPFGER